MKICIFSANYLPNTGGVERYTYYTARELINRGHSVTLVTSNVFNLPTHEIKDGLEIYRYDCYNLLNGRYPVLKYNKSQKSIDSQLIKNNYDLVVVNTRFYIHSLHAVKLAYKNGIKCICIEHGTTHLTVNNKLFDTLGAGFEHLITVIDKRYCKDYYGVSKAACEWSAHFGIKSKGVLYNAVDVDEIETMLQNPVISYRKELGIDENACIITYTGRLIPEKGLIQLVNAFSKLTYPNKALIIAGDGPLYEQIKNSDANGIYLLGKIDFEHIVSLLKETDIFCLPSRSEGFSTSVLEAVATKCYVITTKTGGTKELISGDEYGMLLDNNDTERVYEALKNAVDNPQMRKNVYENAYQKLLDNFTWKKTVDKIEQL
ncbi:MAG: glycosyltransferase family 4 protein [Clostridia bacterium]|nr:glycosyltransferase family 4 protein [Clostridia bacterium]